MFIGKGSWKLNIPPIFKWGSCDSQVITYDIHKYVMGNKGIGTCFNAHNNMHIFQCSANNSIGLNPSQLLGSTIFLISSKIWVCYLCICKKPNRCYDKFLCRFWIYIYFCNIDLLFGLWIDEFFQPWLE